VDGVLASTKRSKLVISLPSFELPQFFLNFEIMQEFKIGDRIMYQSVSDGMLYGNVLEMDENSLKVELTDEGGNITVNGWVFKSKCTKAQPVQFYTLRRDIVDCAEYNSILIRYYCWAFDEDEAKAKLALYLGKPVTTVYPDL
jgi:hypothetical protein